MDSPALLFMADRPQSEAPAQRNGGGAHHDRDLAKRGARFFIMH
jgi:hypothetical protein